jgi:hypothetical protein
MLDGLRRPPKFQVLCCQSPMGSGKSTWMKQIMEELGYLDGANTVIVPSFRILQSLASQANFPSFAYYNKLKGCSNEEEEIEIPDSGGMSAWVTDLENRVKFPRINCQFNSLPMIVPAGQIPTAKLLVCDEFESICAHFSSSTLSNAQTMCKLFQGMMDRAVRVIVLDAHIGQRTIDFLKLSELSYRLIMNDRLSEPSLQCRLALNEVEWAAQIIGNLKLGKNCDVVSMSLTALHRLKQKVLAEDIMTEADMLTLTSRINGEVKMKMMDINSFWRVRLLMRSPAVEAGPDFSVAWFHSRFVYMCKHSTCPRAIIQTIFRTRHAVETVVSCCVQKGFSLVLDEHAEEPVPSTLLVSVYLCIAFNITLHQVLQWTCNMLLEFAKCQEKHLERHHLSDEYDLQSFLRSQKSSLTRACSCILQKKSGIDRVGKLDASTGSGGAIPKEVGNFVTSDDV